MTETMPLSEFVEINPKIKLIKGTEYPFVEMNIVTPGRRYISSIRKRNYKGGGAKFQAGDTLFARITPCLENGKIAQFIGKNGEIGFGSTEFFVFRYKEGISDPGYVFYLANSNIIRKPAEKSMFGASGRQRADLASIKDLEIPAPSLSTQCKIAAILSTYDDLIENNTRRIKILEEMAQTLYREWFVKFRFPGHEKVEKKDIPWVNKKIKDLTIQIIDGDRSKRYPKRNEFKSEGILFLNTKNISNNKINLSDANFITPEKFSQIKKGRIQPLDIIMTTRGSIGKIALFNCEYPTGLINAQMLILRSEDKTIDQMFLFYSMCCEEFQEIIKGFSSGSAQPQIPIKDLKEIEIICPPISLQRKFSDLVTNFNNLIKNLTIKNTNLRRTRDLLLPKLISGEVDVENIDVQMPNNGGA